MQPERQISIFFAATSAAVLVPVYGSLVRVPGYEPGVALLAGTVLGALGVFFGSAVASGQDKWPGRIFLSFWTVLALALTAFAVAGILFNPHWGWRAAFSVAALLPPAAVGVFWFSRK